jgi:hypothetical protein
MEIALAGGCNSVCALGLRPWVARRSRPRIDEGGTDHRQQQRAHTNQQQDQWTSPVYTAETWNDAVHQTNRSIGSM